MTMQPSPDLLDLAEAVAAGTLLADDAERQLRLALGPDHAAESEQAGRELRGLIGAAGAVRAHARATHEAFGSSSRLLAVPVADTPASIATQLPGRVTAGAVHPRSSNGGDGAGRAPRRTWLLAAAALLLVGGAMAAGSGLVKLPSLVPPVPAPTLPVAVASPSPALETPGPVVSPSTAETPWITGQALMDVLSAEYGLRWTPFDDSETSTVTYLSSDPVWVEAPFDRPAKVRVAAGTNAVAGVGLQARRIAQALAPDAAPWIQEAITQGLSADWNSFATSPSDLTSVNRERVMTTASGGQVLVTFVDPPVFGNYLSVTFLFPPPPPRLGPSGKGVVLYPDGDEIWAMNSDGTDAHLLPGVDAPLGWSADGSRLFYDDGDGSVFAIDTDGSPPVRIAGIPELCPPVTVDDTCEANVDEILISPDGRRLAYPIGNDSPLDMMGFFDIATGRVTRVEFDSVGGPACEGPFGGGPLQWSPDGTRFAFGNSVGPRVDGFCQGAVFTVNVDGTDLRRVTSSNVHAMEPHWSPDGSTIVFSRSTPRSAWDRKGDATRIPIDMDIYSVSPDGSGLTGLTSDGVSILPLWTRDGRIVFTRRMHPQAAGELWIMDADGQNATRLDTTVAAQTAAGCLICPYPDEQGILPGDVDTNHRFWQPMPDGQP
jgi:Tol biopolymer transport system component